MGNFTLKKLFKKFYLISKYFFNTNYFGFVRGHDYLTKEDFRYLKTLVLHKNITLVNEFEKEFASLIGPGECFSYASARMGFYEIMKGIGITKDDEII